MRFSNYRAMSHAAAATLLLIMSVPPAQARGSDDGPDPVVDQSKTSQALKNLPRRPIAERPAVAIYEFRSSSYQVTSLAATDMFTTALIDSGQFRVVERARIEQTVIREKQLNAAGQSTGSTAQNQLRGAQYIFEGTISEVNGSEKQNQAGVNVAGLNLGGGNNKAASTQR